MFYMLLFLYCYEKALTLGLRSVATYIDKVYILDKLLLQRLAKNHQLINRLETKTPLSDKKSLK